MSPFETFFDAEDLTACVDATDTPERLNAGAKAQDCVWPLWLEPAQNFGDLFLNVRATPRGFRYGFVGDNVLGLQWRLPSGTELRLGGRVMKNVTGFDLIRFFSASAGRFGTPLKLVLRLRPTAEARLDLRLRGPWGGLESLARAVRSSSWVHALDYCDLHAETRSAAICLGFSAKPALLPLFRSQAQSWAAACGLDMEASRDEPTAQAHPWARAQVSLDDCVRLSKEWLERYGGQVHGLLGQGVLQLQDPGSRQGAEQGLHELHRRLAEAGGHCEHPSLTDDPDSVPARWERELLRRLEAPA